MRKTFAGSALLALSLALAVGLHPSAGWAQSSLPCSGTGTDDGGVIKTNGYTPSGGTEAQCDALVSPSGKVTIQDGPAADAPNGVDATHEGAGGGSH